MVKIMIVEDDVDIMTFLMITYEVKDIK